MLGPADNKKTNKPCDNPSSHYQVRALKKISFLKENAQALSWYIFSTRFLKLAYFSLRRRGEGGGERINSAVINRILTKFLVPFNLLDCLNTMCASKRVRISCCDTTCTIYLSLCRQPADPNTFRGTHCILIIFEAGYVADIKPIPSKLETVDVISRPSKQKQLPSSPKKQVCDLELHLVMVISL